jgi:hypothetical protein
VKPAPAGERAARPGKAWATLLILAAVLPGFVFGAWLGAQFLVPRDAGLAGGAMVFWYGVVGVLMAVVGAVLLARFLPSSRLRLAAGLMAGVTLSLLAWLALLFATSQDERAEQRQQTMTMLPEFELVLAGRFEPGLRHFAYASRDNEWQVERDDGAQCRGGLPAGEAGDKARVALLGALRGLDVAGVLATPPDCQQAGELLALLEVTIYEAKPPVTGGRLGLTTACRNEIPEIAALFEQVAGVYRRHQSELSCE